MADPDIAGFTFSPKRVSYILALVALITLLWGGVSYVNAFDFRLGSAERKIEAREERMTNALNEIKLEIHEIREENKNIAVSVGEIRGIVRGLERQTQ